MEIDIFYTGFYHGIPAGFTTPPVAVKIEICSFYVFVVFLSVFDSHGFGMTLLQADFFTEMPSFSSFKTLLEAGANGYFFSSVGSSADNSFIFYDYCSSGVSRTAFFIFHFSSLF